jgi:hypothetical protein
MAEAGLRPRKWCLTAAGLLQLVYGVLLLPFAMEAAAFDEWAPAPSIFALAVVALLAAAPLTMLRNRWAWALSILGNVAFFVVGTVTAWSRSSSPGSSTLGAAAAAISLLCLAFLSGGYRALAEPRPRPRCATILILVGAAGLAFAMPPMGHCFVTGSWSPIEHVETLSDPVKVLRWTDTALVLADGRQVPLRGIAELPHDSPALTAVTSEGVEVGPDGAVIGMLPIHHYCGNDPVRKHIARVDVAQLLLYLGEGEPTSGHRPQRSMPFLFNQWGWNASEYFAFQGETHRPR